MKGINHNRLRRVCAWIIGVVFVISGVLKLMDPVGAGFVVRSYLLFLHLDFLVGFCKTLGFLFALAETLAGIALVTGVLRRLTAMVTSALLAFFTLLTLLLVIFNPEMDCGCFGDALHLTHAQSFVKNLVLVAMAALAFLPVRDYGVARRSKKVAAVIAAVTVIAFAAYSQMYLPMKDFTPFAPGAVIAAAAPQEEVTYDAKLFYSKDGKQESFTIENLPDSTWTYVRTEFKVVGNDGSEYPMLSFRDHFGVNRDDMAAEPQVLVFTVYNPDRVKEATWQQMESLTRNSFKNGFRPLILISAPPERINAALEPLGETGSRLTQFIYLIDYKTAATLNRSNAGAAWLSNGTVVRKYSCRNLPSPDDLPVMAESETDEVAAESLTRGNLLLQGFLLYLFTVLLLL